MYFEALGEHWWGNNTNVAPLCNVTQLFFPDLFSRLHNDTASSPLAMYNGGLSQRVGLPSVCRRSPRLQEVDVDGRSDLG